MNPLLLVDSYKIHHYPMYPAGMTKLYSNFTPRKSRIEGIDGVVVFGIQHFILEYLIERFNNDFFKTKLRNLKTYSSYRGKMLLKDDIINEYKRHCPVDTSHVEVPIKSKRSVDYIIIDDICDGGATFLNIAKEIRNNHFKSLYDIKIYLIVTHGIFSKGFDELSKYFDGIYCTNSYSNLINNKADWSYSKSQEIVKQLNVF